jgi:hypothetical protein
MKQVTLNIPENQFPFFMKLVRSLNFVQVAEPTNLEDQLSSTQKETWSNIKTGFEELKEVEKGKRKARPVQELLNELGV